ncbi:ABC transporter permease [Paenibacillus albiflavus]|uniref:ABC transporter permease n=1 Tax=Paenibacillus albiflavus TaxID=2545760 RepID=A0A4V2WNF9_9BACL|nr:ABC transporter permease [Paenibacillus albiflavus]TCZ75282.1 ABC transporter permease [Paenibacillus albiflavus]
MKLTKQMLRPLLISAIAMLFVILLVLYPRQLNIEYGKFGLILHPNDQIWSQYVENITGFFRELFVNHSLGPTRDSQITASQTIIQSMNNSIVIIIVALIFGIVFGTLKGILDFKLSNSKFSILGNWTTWLIQSIPDFMLVLIVQWLTIRHLRWIPFFPHGDWSDFILPSILVSIYPIIYLARITSASLATQEGQLYIRVARAKGIKERVILFKHMLYNSMATILTHITPLFVYILSNLLIVEIFSNYPGAAYRLYLAIDYSRYIGTGPNYEPGVIIGIVFCFMVLLIILQFFSQIAKRKFDPR